MTEHVHEYDGFGIILTRGMVERLGDPAFVKCIRCDHILQEGDMLARLNATERLSAEDAKLIASQLGGHGHQMESMIVRAYADILEGKDE